MALHVEDLMHLFLGHVFACKRPMKFMPLIAGVNKKFAAATRTGYLKFLKSTYESAEDAAYYRSDNTGVLTFRVDLLVNGEWLAMLYVPRCGVWMAPYGELPKNSEFTLRIVHRLTNEKWTLQSVRGAEVFHREMLPLVDSLIATEICIEYKITPYCGGLEVNIVGGRGNNWQRTPSSDASELFDFLVPMKQTEDGCNTFMLGDELTSLMIEKLPLFATVIVDGMAQEMKPVNCLYGQMAYLYLKVSAQGLCRTASVNVIFFLELPDSKELVPLTVAKIWKHENCHRWTFNVNIDPHDIDPDEGTIGCELHIDCQDVDVMDTHLISDTLLALRKDS